MSKKIVVRATIELSDENGAEYLLDSEAQIVVGSALLGGSLGKVVEIEEVKTGMQLVPVDQLIPPATAPVAAQSETQAVEESAKEEKEESTPMKLKLKALTPAALEQYKSMDGTQRDAGYDCYVQETVTVHPATKNVPATTIKLGIAAEPETAFRLLPRSSISKEAIMLANSEGTIDQDYRGEIMAKVHNVSSRPITVEAGTRLFQLLAPDMQPMIVELVDELSETERGAGGFGSTGK